MHQAEYNVHMDQYGTGAAAVANGWRLDAAHQLDLAAEKGKRETAERRVIEQNAAVDKLGAEKTAADARRPVAEKLAAAAISRAQRRVRSSRQPGARLRRH